MIAVRAKYFFVVLLENRQYTGRMTFNHKKETLEMFVSMKMSQDMRKPAFCICKNKGAAQLYVNRTDDQHLYFCLNPKFQVSSHLIWLYSLVCVILGRKR